MERSKYVPKSLLSLHYHQLQKFFQSVLLTLRGTGKERKAVGAPALSCQPRACLSRATEATVLASLFLALHLLGTWQ